MAKLYPCQPEERNGAMKSVNKQQLRCRIESSHGDCCNKSSTRTGKISSQLTAIRLVSTQEKINSMLFYTLRNELFT